MQLALVDALTSDERRALALLRGDGLLRWELEDAAGWSAARTQRVLDDLASRGLVECVSRVGSRRENWWALTREGRRRAR